MSDEATQKLNLPQAVANSARENESSSVTAGRPSTRIFKANTNTSEARTHLLTLDALLGIAQRGGASDVLLKVGQSAMFRLNGELYPLRDGPRMDRNMIETMVGCCLTEEQLERLNTLEDIDASYISPKVGRVRINIFRQRAEPGMVIRLIPTEIPSIDGLGMSAIVKYIAEQKRGLVLVTGATGSGKSTTLAAIIDHINRNRTAHIITIEDPVEFIHQDKKSMVNHRELGLDARTFAGALKSALRQNPDVILVGELRDSETMEVAMQAAETGHLVLSTMHTNDAADALTRILGAMGSAREMMIRTLLAENLKSVISQRLVKRLDKKGRVAAQEIMINTATIRERLLKGSNPSVVRDFIAQGQSYGMQTFDQHLLQLYFDGLVEYEEAYTNATNRDDFALKCRGISNASSTG
jgi:twitching motility protein PilT